jgi:hypothetical protein
MIVLPNLRRPLIGALLIGIASWISCASNEAPTSPEVHAVTLSGGKPVQVRDTDPPGTEQGTIDLQVRVLGSGFEAPARVRFLLNGDPTGIGTSAEAVFVSDKELVTTITVAEDATVALWDVEVELLGKGRKGIGIELFAVKEKCLDPEFCTPSLPGVGKGGKKSPVSLGGSYATAADQVVGVEKTGKSLAFEAVGEHKIDYTLDLPSYGGNAVCVSSGLAAGESAADLWNDFVAIQNVVTARSFLFIRFEDRIEGNRTSGIWSVDGVRRHFYVGTTPNALGDDLNATISLSTDGDGNDVCTLTGGALQIIVANSIQDEKRVTCPNTRAFTLTVKR